MYVVTRDELYLVPTAEVPVTNLHRDEILEAAELPIRYAAYSPCFRREAGAAGKDTRGILRVHQFDKVEMVLFEKPEDSPAALEWMTGRAEDLLQRLGLAYRVLLMSTREMGFVQARKYDLEVWSPGVERWLEVSSCSNFRDYQARRMAIRYRPGARREARARAHAQRIGAGPGPDRGRHPGDVPAPGWVDHGAGRAPAVPRSRGHRADRLAGPRRVDRAWTEVEAPFHGSRRDAIGHALTASHAATEPRPGSSGRGSCRLGRPVRQPGRRLGDRSDAGILLRWRGGRAVDGGALEKRRVERLRGFESHPLRHRTNEVPGVRSAAETNGRDRTAARPVRDVSALADDPDGSWLHVPPVRALRDRSAISAVPEPAGAALSRIRAWSAPRLTPAPQPAILPATSRRAGNERDEYPSHVGTETRWLVETGATTTGNGPGSLRTERNAARPPTQ